MTRAQKRLPNSSRLLKRVLFAFLFAGSALNGIAWMQARAMTHYLTGNVVKTQKPEQLSPLQKARVVLTGVRIPRPTNVRTPEDEGLSYETHTIELPSEGTHPEFIEAWIAPAESSKGFVLLFPQYGASKQSVLSPAKAFHDLGYSTMLVDFRGVGGSTGSDTTMGVREGEDVAHAVRYVQQNLPEQPMILYGASQGAAAVMRAVAHEGVQPDAVVLESPFDSLLETVRHRFRASGLPSFPSAELMVFWGGMLQGIDGFAHNPAEYAALMDYPVLLLHGEADTRVLVEDAEAIFDRLPGKKNLVLLPSVGHGAFAHEHPQIWRQTVETFLQDSN
ncbi:MAG: alpha/beta fold hydrolase [Cyanobacteria bacterium J06649_4]